MTQLTHRLVPLLAAAKTLRYLNLHKFNLKIVTAAFHDDVTLYNWYKFHAYFQNDHRTFLNLSVKIILPQALIAKIIPMA